jgi:hypothetical protein
LPHGLIEYHPTLSNTICGVDVYPTAEPWDYPLFILIGGYMGYIYPGWIAKLRADVNAKRERAGMPPVDLGGVFDLAKKMELDQPPRRLG